MPYLFTHMFVEYSHENIEVTTNKVFLSSILLLVQLTHHFDLPHPHAKLLSYFYYTQVTCTGMHSQLVIDEN
jgi:hypothetical protein